MYYQIQIRRGTASEWTATNPILAAGELAVESDTNKMKVGNGSTAWNSLSYATATPTQLNLKADLASPTFTGNVVLPSTTSIGTVSATEIGYVDGVTSAIQTQLDSKITATTAVTSNRNVLINGGLDVWQRGTSFTTGGVYSADRFIIGRSGGGNGATFTRVSPNDSTNLPFFRYAMRCQRDSGNTATNGLTFNQVVETANSIRLAGKQVTLSFYARCGANYTTGTNFYSYVFTGTGTDQNGVLGAWTGSANPINASHTLTTTWQRFSATGTFSSTANEIFISISSVHTGTAGANDWFEITGVQLEAGAVATPFEFEDYSETLAKCQRYYQRGIAASGSGNSTTGIVCVWSLPVSMRATPTLSQSANLNMTDGTNDKATSSPSVTGLDGNTNMYVAVVNNFSGITTNRPYFGPRFTATDGQFIFSAEL